MLSASRRMSHSLILPSSENVDKRYGRNGSNATPITARGCAMTDVVACFTANFIQQCQKSKTCCSDYEDTCRYTMHVIQAQVLGPRSHSHLIHAVRKPCQRDLHTVLDQMTEISFHMGTKPREFKGKTQLTPHWCLLPTSSQVRLQTGSS